MASDIRVAGVPAYFRAAGINNGLTASELGLSYLLPRAIGSARAAEIMLTVEMSTPRRPHASPGEPRRRLRPAPRHLLRHRRAHHRFSQAGIELTKRSLWASLDASSLETHMDAEGLGQLFVRLTTKNFEEAVRARRDKRPPEFTD